MSVTIEKCVSMNTLQAQRLEQIARTTGTPENELIEKALELLFRTTQDEATQREWEYLRELEAELGPVQREKPARKFPSDYEITHEVRIAPESIRRIGEPC